MTAGIRSTAPPPAPLPDRPRLWPLAIGTFAIGFGSNAVTGLLPTMSADLGVGPSEIGRLVSVYGIAYAVSTPLVALVGGRLPRGPLMLTALALFAVASAATAMTSHYAVLSVLRAVSAIAAGAFTPTATVLAARSAAPGMRGRALATVFGGLTTAAVVAAPVGNLLGPTIGYRGVYLLTALLAGIAFVAVLLRVDSSAQASSAEERPAAEGAAALPVPARDAVPTGPIRARRRSALPSPLVSLVLLVSLLETVGAYTVQTYALPLLTALSGAEGMPLSVVLLCYGAAGVLGNIAGGRMSDRLGGMRTLWLCFAGCAVALVLLPVVGSTVLGAGVVFAAWGFLAWAANAPLQGMLIRLAGRFGQLIVALNSSVIALGTAGGALLGGAIVVGGAVPALASAGAALMGLALVLVTLLMRSTRLRAPEPL